MKATDTKTVETLKEELNNFIEAEERAMDDMYEDLEYWEGSSIFDDIEPEDIRKALLECFDRHEDALLERIEAMTDDELNCIATNYTMVHVEPSYFCVPGSITSLCLYGREYEFYFELPESLANDINQLNEDDKNELNDYIYNKHLVNDITDGIEHTGIRQYTITPHLVLSEAVYDYVEQLDTKPTIKEQTMSHFRENGLICINGDKKFSLKELMAYREKRNKRLKNKYQNKRIRGIN